VSRFSGRPRRFPLLVRKRGETRVFDFGTFKQTRPECSARRRKLRKQNKITSSTSFREQSRQLFFVAGDFLHETYAAHSYRPYFVSYLEDCVFIDLFFLEFSVLPSCFQDEHRQQKLFWSSVSYVLFF